MILSAHVAAGALAGMVSLTVTTRQLPRIGLAFALGFLSHAPLDAIPHSDYQPLASSAVLFVALGELVVMAMLLTFMLRERIRPGWKAPLAAGVLGASIADVKFVMPVFGSPALTETVWRYANWFHGFFHATPPSSRGVGLAYEVAATLLLLGALLLFPRSAKNGV